MVEANLLERLMKEYGDSVFRMCFLYIDSWSSIHLKKAIK